MIRRCKNSFFKVYNIIFIVFFLSKNVTQLCAGKFLSLIIIGTKLVELAIKIF